MPILKQLVSGSSQSKRRSRADLTPEMISAPLGDFRHTMHVGRGGDTFGDTSFLSSRSGEPPRQPTDALPAPPAQHQYQMQQHPSHPPPPPPDSSPPTQHHKPSLLSRTFRSSKRSQSVNRADKHKSITSASSSSIMVSAATATMLLPGNGSPTHVKTAISLPYLNESGGGGGGLSFPKSVSSSPLKRGAGSDVIDGQKPANGSTAAAAAALAMQEPDLLEAERERRFGDLSDLPPSLPRGGGMKHAESIMSFHIDLGPSMLGDILSVMDKPGWDCDNDDLGFEDGRGSPSLSPSGGGRGGSRVDHHNDGNDDLLMGGGGGFGGSSDDNEVPSPPAPSRPPRITSPSHYAPNNSGGAIRPPGGQHRYNNQQQQHMDSCSVSSSGSTVQEERLSGIVGGHGNHGYQRQQLNHSNQSGAETDGDSARFSSPGRSTTRDEERDFSFMDDDDDDEIRV